MKKLATVEESASSRFLTLMRWLRGFSAIHSFTCPGNGVIGWEYPWIWEILSQFEFKELRLLDLFPGTSPIPWFYASLGATVAIVDREPSLVPKWINLKERNDFSVCWRMSSVPHLPFPDDSFDAVTWYGWSRSQRSIDEPARLLRGGGILCLTFSLPNCSKSIESDLVSIDDMIGQHESLELMDPISNWNTGGIKPFLAEKDSITGGMVLRKKGAEGNVRPRFRPRSIRAHQLDTGLGSGNTGDDAMFMAAHSQIPIEFELTTEVHSLNRVGAWPAGVRYIAASENQTIERSISTSDVVLLMGDTPIMEDWGLQWPLLANDAKLQLCHKLGKPVHAVGIGVDRLKDREALLLFERSYPQFASWTVRSEQCRRNLIEMGVPGERIVVGADWAWLFEGSLDSLWAEEMIFGLGARRNRPRLGINVVNEMWRGNHVQKSKLASVLDRLIEEHDLEVFFFCNESRAGDYYDRAAAMEVRAGMRHASFLLPDRYYTPKEAISLLSRMNVTLSQRYHFTLFSILANVYPISIVRGQKMKALNEDLDLPFLGNMQCVDEDRILAEIPAVLQNPEQKFGHLRVRMRELKVRALRNLTMVRAALGLNGASEG
jgi:polysaccharide pyruvyl transferase WcaK-like protein/SAM-dependent methyltransferase